MLVIAPVGIGFGVYYTLAGMFWIARLS